MVVALYALFIVFFNLFIIVFSKFVSAIGTRRDRRGASAGARPEGEAGRSAEIENCTALFLFNDIETGSVFVIGYAHLRGGQPATFSSKMGASTVSYDAYSVIAITTYASVSLVRLCRTHLAGQCPAYRVTRSGTYRMPRSGIYRTAQSFVNKSRSSAQYIERLCRISSALARTYIVSITAMTGLWSEIYSPSTGSSGITSDSETSQGISVKI